MRQPLTWHFRKVGLVYGSFGRIILLSAVAHSLIVKGSPRQKFKGSRETEFSPWLAVFYSQRLEDSWQLCIATFLPSFFALDGLRHLFEGLLCHPFKTGVALAIVLVRFLVLLNGKKPWKSVHDNSTNQRTFAWSLGFRAHQSCVRGFEGTP